jgi:hypothetical protein
MRIATLALAVVAFASPMIVHAQDSTRADEQIIIKQVQTDRRAVYAANLNLTDEESKAFWPIYDEYEGAIKKVADKRLALLDQYAAKYDSLTNEDADAMLAERMKLDKEYLAIRQKYAKKVQKALPSVKALRYVQLQDRIDNMLASNIYSLIPLAH